MYIIKPNEWKYDNGYPRFQDDVYGFIVEVRLDYRPDSKLVYGDNIGVKLLGTSMSVIDAHNGCYYDLSSNVFANRVWSNVYCRQSDIFDSDGHVRIDIKVPSWFVNHAASLMDKDAEYDHIFASAFDGVTDANTGWNNIVQRLRDYNIKHCLGLNANQLYDIIDVANGRGYMYSANEKYVVSI